MQSLHRFYTDLGSVLGPNLAPSWGPRWPQDGSRAAPEAPSGGPRGRPAAFCSLEAPQGPPDPPPELDLGPFGGRFGIDLAPVGVDFGVVFGTVLGGLWESFRASCLLNFFPHHLHKPFPESNGVCSGPNFRRILPSIVGTICVLPKVLKIWRGGTKAKPSRIRRASPVGLPHGV